MINITDNYPFTFKIHKLIENSISKQLSARNFSIFPYQMREYLEINIEIEDEMLADNHTRVKKALKHIYGDKIYIAYSES